MLRKSYAVLARNAAPITNAIASDHATWRILRWWRACSIQKIGIELPRRRTVNTTDRCSSGGVIPGGGHTDALARTKKYAESKDTNTIASVAMSTAMPHQAVG